MDGTARRALSAWSSAPGWNHAAAVAAALAALVVGATLALQIAYADRIVPGVRVLGLDVGGQSSSAARVLLGANASRLGEELVTLRADRREWQVAAADLGLRVDVDTMVERAYDIAHVGNPVQRATVQWATVLFGARLGSPLVWFEADRQEAILHRIAGDIDRDPVDALIEVQIPSDGSVAVVVTPEVPGARLDIPESAERIRRAVSHSLPATVDLAIATEHPRLTRSSIEPTRAQAQGMVEGPVVLTSGSRSWSLTSRQVAQALDFQRVAEDRLQVVVNAKALEPALEPVYQQIGEAPKNARFDWNGGNLRVIQPDHAGTVPDVEALARKLEEGLPAGERAFALRLRTASAAVRTPDGPRLPIKELIKEGRTDFPGASAAKQHNVRLAAANLHGTVVPPGATFSFNREVGPTTLDAGYRTGWGITLSGSGARTIPSVAGGICQVATTLFHPVFHAGYAVEQRQPHLYWIQSYGQPPLGMKGLDTTVDEDAGLDFQFINTTPDYLLIQARVQGTTLVFGLYGTKPTWDVKIEGPVITNVVPTDPRAVRQLDPTMPPGQSLQVEAAQDGFDVTVVRTVSSGDDVRQLRLRSHYLPARNVVLHGPVPPPRAEPTESESGEGGPTNEIPPSPEMTASPAAP